MMELTFENLTGVGSGANPAVLHMPDNSAYLFFVNGGRLKAQKWEPETGDVPWDNPVFGNAAFATRDKNLSLMRMKNVPRVGVFGAWHQDEVLDDETVLTPERQRFAIWDAITDISNYLESGSIRLDLNNIISSASLAFKNPNQILSGEVGSLITPGNKIELYFTAGDYDEYQMGVFYVDRTEMSATGDSVDLDLRNISGKLLKDQTFDENNSYPIDVYAYLVAAILDNAGIAAYQIQQSPDPETAWQCGIEYPSDMDMLTGLNEFLKMALTWTAVETLDGQIIVGSSINYAELTGLYGNYEFERGSELTSRGVTRDDDDVYSRVCYQSKESMDGTMIKAYAQVLHALEWASAPHKTLYVTLADDTVLSELQDQADELAERLAYAGIVEQFSGPFRPHIIPGDEATITEADSSVRLVGLITTVEHSFGDKGFTTSFTVDGAGRKGKPQLKDMMQTRDTSANSSVKRLY
jgi:hypothetical protein